MARSHISLTNLDFDGIKDSLKTFLKSQTEFADYNWEGASLNIMLDVLAANTHYYALYNSLMANEMFIDSAQLRSSVVSHAKTLGYTPRSVQSSKAIVGLTVSDVPGSPTSILVPRGYSFETTIDDNSLTFKTIEDVYLLPTGNVGEYSIASIDIYEGKTGTYSYTVTGETTQRFIIPNKNVDTRNIRVLVQQSATNSYKEVYTSSSKILGLTKTFPVFFIQETTDGEWEILFGEGILGKQPSAGNIVLIEYTIPTPGVGDGASTFTISSPVFSGALHTVSVVQPASGALLKEDVESIRVNAKRNFSSQERSVTPYDYETNIKIDYPSVLDVKSWGGEDNDPPIYGKVFVSILPSNLQKLTSAQKTSIIDLIKRKNVINIRPVIVDPELESIRIDGHVRYNEKTLNILPGDLKTSVVNAIKSYNTSKLLGFDKMYSYSEMLKFIGAANANITSSDFRIYLGLRIQLLTISSSFKLNFRNQIDIGSVWTEGFVVGTPVANVLYYLGDDNLGNIKLYSVTGGDMNTKTEIPGKYGTVDYVNGIVNIQNFTATSLNGYNTLKIEAKPVNQEVLPYFNQVLFIDTDNLKVEVIPS